VAVSTSPVRYTMPLLVSTPTRDRVLSRSPSSWVFTYVVRVPSSMFCPAVSPVIAWQPVMKKKTTNVTANILNVRIINTSYLSLRFSYFHPASFHSSCSLTRPIPYTFVDAHEIGIGVAARVLLQLHGDLISALQLGDRVFSAVIKHTSVSTITNHPVAAVVRSQMNLPRRSIYSDNLREDLFLIQLKRRSAHQGDVVAATYAHRQRQTDNYTGRGAIESIHNFPPPNKGSILFLSATYELRILCGIFSRLCNHPPAGSFCYGRYIHKRRLSRGLLVLLRPRTRNRFDPEPSRTLTPTLFFSFQPPRSD